MSSFLAEWGLAILISLAVLGVLIWAEWRDNRDGLYDDDDDRSVSDDDTETLRCIFCQRTIEWPTASIYPGACLYCDRSYAYTAEPVTTVGPYSIDREPVDHD